MSAYTPKLPPRGAVLTAWLRAHPFWASSTVEDRTAEFEMWEAHIKAQALEEAANAFNWAGRHEDYKPVQGWLRNRAQQIKEEA